MAIAFAKCVRPAGILRPWPGSSASSTSWPVCGIRRAAVPGTSSRTSPPSPPSRSRRPTRSTRRSRAGTPKRSGTSSETCSSRWSSRRGSRRRRGSSLSTASSRRSPTSSFVAVESEEPPPRLRERRHALGQRGTARELGGDQGGRAGRRRRGRCAAGSLRGHPAPSPRAGAKRQGRGTNRRDGSSADAGSGRRAGGRRAGTRGARRRRECGSAAGARRSVAGAGRPRARVADRPRAGSARGGRPGDRARPVRLVGSRTASRRQDGHPIDPGDAHPARRGGLRNG